MNMRTSLSALLLAILSSTAAGEPNTRPPIQPSEAIQLATSAGPERGVKGTFLVTVNATGHDETRIYLNSEFNYRDSNCLTITLERSAIRWLKKKYGPDIESHFKGKTIEVTGTARRVAIYSTRYLKDKNVAPPIPLYFQTHVLVDKSDQIVIVD